jgi:4-amino-4-deoxy-L-arabinose transferase-like glycosyltransferase
MNAHAAFHDRADHLAPLAVPLEVFAYAVIVAIALGLRALQLDAAPLNEIEAWQALAALSFVTSGSADPAAIVSPLIFAGQIVAFALAGATNAAARFLPLLGGVLLVCAPLAFRRHLGRLPALIACAALALSPAAVAASRHASGAGLSMLALVLVLLAFDRWLDRRSPRWAAAAGVALGAAFLAGSGALMAALTLAVGFLFAVLTDEEDLLIPDVLRPLAASIPWRSVAAALAITAALGATVFAGFPGGLGAAGDQFVSFLQGFVRPAPGAAYLGVVLLLAEPGLLLFGMIGAWLASQSEQPWQRFVAGWAIAALIASLLYRGAAPEHALWSAVPLAVLAALAVDRLLALRHEGPPWVPRAVAAGLLALTGMTLASVTQLLQSPTLIAVPPGAAPEQVVFTFAVEAALTVLWLILFGLLWLTAASMWGARTAWRGYGLGALIIFTLVAGGQSASLAFTRATSPYDPLNAAPATPALNMLAETAREIGDFAGAHPYDVDIEVQADSGAAVIWALRGFHNVTVVDHVDPQVQSTLVITPGGADSPALGSSYVGQDCVTTRAWTPRGLALEDVIRWVIYRRAPTPTADTRAIMWVREDVFRLAHAASP